MKTFADIAITGATILTSDPARPVLRGGTIEIAGDRILSVAPDRDAPPVAARIIDGRGKLVTPGFVNVHTHAILSMVRGVAEDMGFAPAYTMGVPHGHDVRPDEAVALSRLGAVEALCFGSTLINDSFVHQELALTAMAEVGIRAWGCGRIHDVDFSRVHLGEWEYDPAIGQRTLKLAADLVDRFHGPTDLKTGVVLAPHAPDTCSPALLRETRELRDAHGLRINTHVAQSLVETRLIRERDGLTPPELLDDVGLLDDKLIAAHCLHLTDDDIQRLGKAGAHLAHIAKGNQTQGSTAPTDRLRRAGMRLALATDNMHADMVELMRWALATARLQEGRVTENWRPAHVFEAATMGGARALGLEKEIGSLEVGKRADLVIFDLNRPHLVPHGDPMGTLVHTGQGRDVETVMVDGEIVVEDGRPVRVDLAALLADADRAAEALWSRAREEARDVGCSAPEFNSAG